MCGGKEHRTLGPMVKRSSLLLVQLCLACCVIPSFCFWRACRARVRWNAVQSAAHSFAEVVVRQNASSSTMHYGTTKGSQNDFYHELTPSVQVKHYCPSVFRSMRELVSESDDHLSSSLHPANLTFFSADSKSGQLFLRSNDDSIIVKTVTAEDSRSLRAALDVIHSHLQRNNRCALNELLGLFRVRQGRFFRRKTTYVLASRNAFQSITGCNSSCEKYDLKGSTIGRHKSADSDVLKDNDLITRNASFLVDTSALQDLQSTLDRDFALLTNLSMMDYSILLTREFATVGNVTPFVNRHSRALIFPSANRAEVLRVSIIDFLQKYTFRKRLEHFFKSLWFGRESISCVPPVLYANRLLKFVTRIMQCDTNAK